MDASNVTHVMMQLSLTVLLGEMVIYHKWPKILST